MDYARDRLNRKIVAAGDASHSRLYECPRPGCGGRVYLPYVRVQRPHFRHHPGEGTTECDEYYPGAGYGHDSGAFTVAAVEDDSSDLGMLLAEVDGRWGLGLRLPEIPAEQLGDASIGVLRSAMVEVLEGTTIACHVSALELRPGIGSARVDISPGLQAYRTQTSGSWPDSIDQSRWSLESRCLEATGSLFRLRRGEWVRLRINSSVHYGETLLVLADARCIPPDPVLKETHARVASTGMLWVIWEVQLPYDPVSAVIAWLTRLGHQLVPRPWSLECVTPARAYDENNQPVFWVGDSPVLVVDAPQQETDALVAAKVGSNMHSSNVRVPETGIAYVALSRRRDVGSTHVAVIAERGARLDINFISRPTSDAIVEILALTPRLYVWIGEQVFEAWRGLAHRFLIKGHEQPQVRVDLGSTTARVRVTIWERGKQRTRPGLDARSAERTVEAVLATASRITLDAESLGRIELLPALPLSTPLRTHSREDRLAWRDYIAGSSRPTNDSGTIAFVEQPRGAPAFVARSVAPATLVRTRLAQRRRRDEESIS